MNSSRYYDPWPVVSNRDPNEKDVEETWATSHPESNFVDRVMNGKRMFSVGQLWINYNSGAIWILSKKNTIAYWVLLHEDKPANS